MTKENGRAAGSAGTPGTIKRRQAPPPRRGALDHRKLLQVWRSMDHALMQRDEGLDVPAFAKQFKVRPSAVRRWMDLFKELGKTIVEREREGRTRTWCYARGHWDRLFDWPGYPQTRPRLQAGD
jgi:hypothetical protein